MQKLDKKTRKKHLDIHHRLTNHIISMAAPPNPENKKMTPKAKNLNFSNKFFRNMMKKKEYKFQAEEGASKHKQRLQDKFYDSLEFVEKYGLNFDF